MLNGNALQWAKIMPEWMHNNDNYRVLKLLTDAAHFLGQDNMFKRYSLDGGRTILVNGYSITNYYEPLTSEDLSKMEWTWIYTDEYKLANEKVRPPIRAIRHQMEPYMVQGKQWKSPYFLHKLKNVDKDRGRATFIYRNEQGKEITIDWVE